MKRAGRRLEGSDENVALFGTEGRELESSANGNLLFFAPEGSTYDARLVAGLYDFESQGASLIRITLFTTALQQFSMAGLNPKHSDYQHLGLTIEFSKPVTFAGGSWRFLTLEMMSSGMMWTLNAESEPTTNYDYQKKLSLSYDSLSPKVVARYVAEQQGRHYVYGKTDCQTIAMELASRLALHGRRLSSPMTFSHGPAYSDYTDINTQQVTGRFFVALVVLGLAVTVLFVIARMLYRYMGPTTSMKMGMPALFGLALFSGSPVPPFAVGGLWLHLYKKNSPTDKALLVCEEGEE